jgi:Skp family chaperone for outer membrane proteins
MTTRAALAALVLTGCAGIAIALGAWKANEPFQATPVKIAIIDSRVLIDQAPGSDAAKKMLDVEVGGMRAMATRWQDTLTTMKKKLADEEAGLTAAARASRQKNIDDLLEVYQRRTDSLQQVVQKRNLEVMQPVLDLVNKVIQDIRDTEGYALVWDIGSGSEGVVAYDKNLNITDRVLAKVKQQPEPKLPAPMKPGGAPASKAAGVKPPPKDTMGLRQR